MTTRSAELAVGDVFSVPIDSTRSGLGQVVARFRREAWYFAVFDMIAECRHEELTIEMVEEVPLLFLVLSLDAKVAVGDWHILGNSDPVETATAVLPAYKEAAGRGTIEIVDYSGRSRRPASPEEQTAYPFRKVVAPVRIENALKAYVGIGEWLPIFEALRPTDMTSAKAFAS